MKFRKKPIVIDAEQWFPGRQVDGVVIQSAEFGLAFIRTSKRNKMLSRKRFVSPGDWIITGIKGEKHLCKPDVFEATYEVVEEVPHADARNAG